MRPPELVVGALLVNTQGEVFVALFSKIAGHYAIPGGHVEYGETVADALVRELCRQLGAPLAGTSANRHGQPPPVTADEVQSAIGGCIPLLLDGGPCPGGVASTVLDLTVSPPVILRPGPVTSEQLAAVVDQRPHNGSSDAHRH